VHTSTTPTLTPPIAYDFFCPTKPTNFSNTAFRSSTLGVLSRPSAEIPSVLQLQTVFQIPISFPSGLSIPRESLKLFKSSRQMGINGIICISKVQKRSWRSRFMILRRTLRGGWCIVRLWMRSSKMKSQGRALRPER
jgi:hypothetical protein